MTLEGKPFCLWRPACNRLQLHSARSARVPSMPQVPSKLHRVPITVMRTC